MRKIHIARLCKILIAFLMVVAMSSECITVNAANNGKLEVFVSLDRDAADYDRVDVKVVSLGRTAKESISTSSYRFYNDYIFMNYVYGGRILVNAMWFERGAPNPVAVNTLVLSRDDISYYSDKELKLLLSPKSIVVNQ